MRNPYLFGVFRPYSEATLLQPSGPSSGTERAIRKGRSSRRRKEEPEGRPGVSGNERREDPEGRPGVPGNAESIRKDDIDPKIICSCIDPIFCLHRSRNYLCSDLQGECFARGVCVCLSQGRLCFAKGVCVSFVVFFLRSMGGEQLLIIIEN